MTREEIGFIQGMPQNRDSTWQTVIKGRTFSFKKSQVRKGLFLYNCQCRNERASVILVSSTGFYSERDLTRVEVEALPQFAAFIDGCTRV